MENLSSNQAIKPDMLFAFSRLVMNTSISSNIISRVVSYEVFNGDNSTHSIEGVITELGDNPLKGLEMQNSGHTAIVSRPVRLGYGQKHQWNHVRVVRGSVRYDLSRVPNGYPDSLSDYAVIDQQVAPLVNTDLTVLDFLSHISGIEQHSTAILKTPLYEYHVYKAIKQDETFYVITRCGVSPNNNELYTCLIEASDESHLLHALGFFFHSQPERIFMGNMQNVEPYTVVIE